LTKLKTVLRALLRRPIQWLAERFSSRPDKERIFDALSQLLRNLENRPGKDGFVLPFVPEQHKFILFSDQHKGARNGADDFVQAEPNYLAALHHYNQENYHLICLGDSEEFWENTILQVKRHHQAAFAAERRFADRNAFTKIFGNHDLDWQIDLNAQRILKDLYGNQVVALEAIILRTTIGDKPLDILCTHGHQGDRQSDGNLMTKFFVAKIWAPLQTYLAVNTNTPSQNSGLKSLHNQLMYEWSCDQHQVVLITGHTHQPVFASRTELEYQRRKEAEALQRDNPQWAEAINAERQWTNIAGNKYDEDPVPSYFNTGCCCFEDGHITGIEIAEGEIRLIRWSDKTRVVIASAPLSSIANHLSADFR